MIDNRRLFSVADRTRVLILDLEWGFYAHVRVLDGPQSGRDAWLAFQRLALE